MTYWQEQSLEFAPRLSLSAKRLPPFSIFRFNHLLLPRATSLFHRQPFLPLAGRGLYFTYQPMPEYVSYDLPFTREGGWGYGPGEQMVGAPGDATVLNAGTRSSKNNQAGHGFGGGIGGNTISPANGATGRDTGGGFLNQPHNTNARFWGDQASGPSGNGHVQGNTGEQCCST